MNENFIIAVLLRTGRSAAGWSQDEFAHLLGVAKSTVARAEIMEMPIKAELYLKALRIFKQNGVEVEALMDTGEIALKISSDGLLKAEEKLLNYSKNRERRKEETQALREVITKDDNGNSVIR